MNTSQMALHVPVYPPASRAFAPLLRLIPNCIETFGCRQTAALCRVLSRMLFAQLADGAFDTVEAQSRMASIGITKDDIHRFCCWLLTRASEMDVEEVR